MSRARYSLVLLDELIVEILSRVSVKDLMRFRCIHKSWNSIIFDPILVKLHFERSSKKPQIILTLEDVTYEPEEDEDLNTCAIPYSINRLFENPSSTIDEDGCYQLKTKYWVVGSCNGLVCLIGSNIEDEVKEYWVRFWNPATRMRSKKSPCLRVSPCCRRFGSISVRYGFGYDDSCNIYKVVLVLSDCKSKKTEVKVLCLGDNNWRNILSCTNFPILNQNKSSLQ